MNKTKMGFWFSGLPGKRKMAMEVKMATKQLIPAGRS